MRKAVSPVGEVKEREAKIFSGGFSQSGEVKN